MRDDDQAPDEMPDAGYPRGDGSPPATAAPRFTHRDRAEANAKLRELIAASEADRARAQRSRSRRDKELLRLKQQGFTPEEIADHVQDLEPVYPGDPALHEALHAHHYHIDRIERALNFQQPSRARKD